MSKAFMFILIIFLHFSIAQNCNWKFYDGIGTLGANAATEMISYTEIPKKLISQIDSFFVSKGKCLEKEYRRGYSFTDPKMNSVEKHSMQLIFSLSYPGTALADQEIEFISTKGNQISSFPAIPKCDTVLQPPGKAAQTACRQLVLSKFNIRLVTTGVKTPVYRIQTMPDARHFELNAINLELMDSKNSSSTIEVPMDLNDLF